MAFARHVCTVRHCLSSKAEKGGFPNSPGTHIDCLSKENWNRLQHSTAASCSTHRATQGVRNEERPTVSLYLDVVLYENTSLQVSIHGSDALPGRGIPWRGSCHLVEADMGHTLAQSCLIELWSGARRTCIKTRRQIHTMKMTLSTSICIYIYTYMQMIAYINI